MSRQGCGPLPRSRSYSSLLEGWKESARQASLGADLDISRTVLARARRDYSKPACMLCCLARVVSVQLIVTCGNCKLPVLCGCWYRTLQGVAKWSPLRGRSCRVPFICATETNAPARRKSRTITKVN